MKIVGLTGGIGSGKTTVAKFFAEFKNVAIYIADVEAKKLMNSSEIIKTKLVKEFGKESFIKGELNRTFIAEIVFKDKAYIIYENAILFESKSNIFCDIIITVYADLNTKINRVIARDSSTKTAVLSRMKSQWSDAKKMLQSNYLIYNEKLEDTVNQVHKIHNILTQ